MNENKFKKLIKITFMSHLVSMLIGVSFGMAIILCYIKDNLNIDYIFMSKIILFMVVLAVLLRLKLRKCMKRNNFLKDIKEMYKKK